MLFIKYKIVELQFQFHQLTWLLEFVETENFFIFHWIVLFSRAFFNTKFFLIIYSGANSLVASFAFIINFQKDHQNFSSL